MKLARTTFVRSASAPRDFIRDGLPQIVFAGRSNVGKSSLMNRLLSRKNLVRVSATPGKTAQVNFFDVDGGAYFVDLPGYGYARVPQTERERWGRMMEGYFASGLVSCGVQLVDARHKPTADDVTMCEWFKASGAPLIVAANKVDKLKKSEREGNLQRIRETLELSEPVKAIYCSAETGEGMREILDALGAALGTEFS